MRPAMCMQQCAACVRKKVHRILSRTNNNARVCNGVEMMLKYITILRGTKHPYDLKV